MVTPLIAANWKMHKTLSEATDFARQAKAACSSMKDRDIVIAPPFTALAAVGAILKESPVRLAAQNMHWEERGAFTGEISAAMLVDAGCDYVIIGHSERRHLFGETDNMINRKLASALKTSLKPIVCVGETLEEREAGQTFHIIREQLHKGLNNISSDDIRRSIIAYEPVWAIGTGKTATPDQAEEAHLFIRDVIGDLFGESIGDTMRILYGGSVTPDNVACLMAKRHINGALVGGASLDIESFTKIAGF
jgi:triosephosphate isomerase